jgi:hypothetical protein
MRVLATGAVRFSELTAALLRILAALFDVASRRPTPARIYITCIFNGNHMEGSRHYKNEAVDFYTAHGDMFFDELGFKSELDAALGDRFTVLLEDAGTKNAHFHVQPKKGTVYP